MRFLMSVFNPSFNFFASYLVILVLHCLDVTSFTRGLKLEKKKLHEKILYKINVIHEIFL